MTMTFNEIKDRESRAVCNTYGRYPLAVTAARGSRLIAPDGREYIDLLAGIAVANLGHSRPELTSVMREQADKLIHVSNLFYQEEQVVLAEKLLATCHAGRVFFCNSGAEANEAAIKLARRYMRKVKGSGAFEVITLEGSFHGRTLATLTATGQDKVKEGFDPLPPGFVTVPWNDLPALERAMSGDTAAVLLEVVQGEGGVRPLPAEYLRGVEELCRRRGVLFMIDEVQTGMCRTGRFWAHQHFGLRPDVFTAAKALANGLPMGAMLATAEVAAGFCPGSHATTFGGSGLLSAVAAKVVDILVGEKLCERAERVGRQAVEQLDAVRAKHPGKIATVRGLGMMLGVELTFQGGEVWRQLLERGFVLNLTQERVLRLLPALTIPEEDLTAFAAALDDILAGC